MPRNLLLVKGKKLYGESANIARTVLEQCCLDVLGVESNKIAENAAYLCQSCHAELSRLTKLKEALQTLKQSISDKVNTPYSSSGAAASLNRHSVGPSGESSSTEHQHTWSHLASC